jgi:hypothetical protein
MHSLAPEGVSVLRRASIFSRAQVVGALALLLLVWLVVIIRLFMSRA